MVQSELEDSLLAAVASIRALKDDARLLAAGTELEALEQRIEEVISSGSLKRDGPELEKVRVALEELNAAELRDRSRRIREALAESSADIGDEWILGSHLFGVTTYYQVEGDGNILVRMEGTRENLPFFDLVAVAYEVGLYHSWVPLCASSTLLAQKGKCEFLVNVNLSAPFPFMMSRELVMHAFASECLNESGSVVVLSRSVESFPDVAIPPAEPSFFHDRAEVKTMKICVQLASATSARIVLISKIDVKVPLPQSMLNFLIKKLAGVFLYFLEKKAIEVHDSTSCPHIDAIKEKTEFYKDWIIPKMVEYFAMMGWGAPPLPAYLRHHNIEKSETDDSVQ